MKNNKRRKPYKLERISSEVEKIIQEVVAYEINDKRVSGNATVTGIQLSPDFSYCKVYVEIPSDIKKEVLEGLKSASGYIRHAISDSLEMRKIPELNFIYDDTKEKAARIEELLADIKKT